MFLTVPFCANAFCTCKHKSKRHSGNKCVSHELKRCTGISNILPKTFLVFILHNTLPSIQVGYVFFGTFNHANNR